MDQVNDAVNISGETDNICGLPFQSVGCSFCGHTYLVSQMIQQSSDDEWVCPNCAQANLQPLPVHKRDETPEKLIRFQVHPNDLQSIFEVFIKKVWLRCEGFNAGILLNHTKRLYLPMWMVDSHITGNWKAEMAYKYQVKSSQDTYTGNQWVSRENLEDRLRWEPRLGQIDVKYENTITQALRDHDQWIHRVGNFSLDTASPYQPDWIHHAILCVPDLGTQEVWPLVKDAIHNRLGQDCAKAAGAQQQKSFTAKVEYKQFKWSQLLLPVYSTWYEDDKGKRHAVYINGQNGRISGLRMASQKKGWKWAGIIAACGLAVCFLALICLALSTLVSEIEVIAAVLFLLGALILFAAVIPAVQPWLWNYRQHE